MYLKLYWLLVLFTCAYITTQTACSPAAPVSENPTLVNHMPTQTPSSTLAGSWSAAPPMQVAHSAHAVVSSNSAIYALGGTNEKGKPILELETFDGTEWKTETSLPGHGLNAPTASIINNKIYIAGGFTATTSLPTDEVLIYDLQSQQWGAAAPLPNPRGGHAAVVLNDRIHLLGGGNSQSTIADHSEYDPATNMWRELAPLPRAQGSPAAVVVNGKIYVLGGRSGYSDFGDVYIYDPTSDSWSTGPAIEPRGTAGAVFYCGSIYLFGGESQAQKKNLDSVLRLDIQKNSWEPASPMPSPRKFARAVLFENSVYIVGGSVVLANSHSPIGSSSVEKFTQPDCQ